MSEKTTETKAGFGSKLGFILAAAGSAVGLGNIWRFPYLASDNGGGIFLLVYLILAVTFGFALMVTEIAIGRRTGKSAIGAYTEMSKKFAPLGWIASAVPVIILPYYCVIGGWVLKYFTLFLTSEGMASSAASYLVDGTETVLVTDAMVLTEEQQKNVTTFFGLFTGEWLQPLLFFSIYLALTAIVVMLGVQKGVELVSKFMMPVLLVMIVGIAIYTLTLPDAMTGLLYYVTPDFKKFSLETVVSAMGQLFYSMSLAMGIMITYGSYMRKEDHIEGSVRHIEIFDTAVAFLAGLIIVPTVEVFKKNADGTIPVDELKGPGLMFKTMPKIFEDMPFGQVIGAVFFGLVILAALTSSISLMETVVSILCEKTKIKRIPACLIVLGFSFLLGLLSVFGSSIWAGFTILPNMDFLTFFDFISNYVMMPLVALATCILVGYVVKTKFIEDEVEKNGAFKAKGLYRVMVKYICPVCLVAILIYGLIETFASHLLN